MKRALLLAGITPLLIHSSAFAAPKRVAQVGSCKTDVTMFSTIGAALLSVPSGSTIYVCPGVYAEQVNITQSVSLVGVSDATSSAPTIVPPSGGIVQNATSLTSGAALGAQIVAKNAGTVIVSNLTVDGTGASGNGISSCTPALDGILFQNTAGTIQNNQVVNQLLTANLNGCQGGDGIYVQGDGNTTFAVKILSNQVANFQKNGITVNETNVTGTIIGNTVTGQGPTAGAAENGIQIGFGATGTISGNRVADLDYTGNAPAAAIGVLLDDAPSAIITGNSVTNTQSGVYVYEDGSATDTPSITKNTIVSTHIYDGIDVCGVTNGTITGNVIDGSDESAVHVDGECSTPSTATVESNKVNGACVGVLVGPNATATTTKNPNILVNAITNTLTESDSCPGTAPQRPAHGGARQNRRVSPSR